MKLSPKIKKFQEGGAMKAAPVEDPSMDPNAEGAMTEGAPAQEGQDPLMQLAQMAMQALQSQDCNMAMQVCQMFVQMLQQAQGGGAPAEPQGEPVFRKGGRFSYRIKR